MYDGYGDGWNGGGYVKVYAGGNLVKTEYGPSAGHTYKTSSSFSLNGASCTGCSNVTSAGQISGEESQCGAYDPAMISSAALPTGGSGDLEYVWVSVTDYNNTNYPSSWTMESGSNSATFDPGTISQTTWYRRCARRVGCDEFTGESNWIKKEVTTCSTPTVAGDCLNANGGFEGGAAGYYGSGAAYIISYASHVNSGSRAGMIGDAQGGISFGYNSSLQVAAGEAFTLSVMAKVSHSPSWAGFGVDYMDANGQEIGEKVVTVNSSSYQKYTISETAPVGTAYIGVWFWKSGSYGRMYIDDICLQINTPEIPHGNPESNCEVSAYASNGHVFWMPGMEELGLNRLFMWESGSGDLELFDDNTARLTGTIVNTSASDVKFEVAVDFYDPKTWAEWSALGHSYKGGFQAAHDNHTDWTYWEMFGTLTGSAGSRYAGEVLTMTQRPENGPYRSQYGVGANDKDEDFGLSTWFSVSGALGSHTFTDTRGDINIDADCGTTTGGEICDGLYVIEAKHSGQALNIPYYSSSNGTQLVQYPYQNRTNQQFIIEKLSDGTYRIQGKHSGLFLDAQGYGTTNGTIVHQWGWHGANNQRWTIEEVEPGYYNFKNVHNGLCLDVQGNSQQYEAKLHLWDCHGGDNQKFKLTPLDVEDCGREAPAGLGDFVWEDLNGNGIQEPGEPGVADVGVNLLDENGNPVLDANGDAITTTTDENGAYKFEELEPGRYIVEFVSPEGYDPTHPDLGGDDALDSDADESTGRTAVIDLEAGEFDSTIDAGLCRKAALGNFVWEDLDRDGIQDAGEPGINGVTVRLYKDSNLDGIPDTVEPIATMETYTRNGVDGSYVFDFLEPGSYIVEFVLPPNASSFTQPLQGNDEYLDSDADLTTGRSQTVTIISGEFNHSIDAGIIKNVKLSLGNRIWNDLNGDGDIDSGELGIDGVVVELIPEGSATAIATTTTSNGGYYLFTEIDTDLYGADFIVRIAPENFLQGGALEGLISSEGNGGDDNVDSDDNGIDNGARATEGISSAIINLLAGNEPEGESDVDGSAVDPADDNSSNLTVDFGFLCPPSQVATAYATDAEEAGIDTRAAHAFWMDFQGFVPTVPGTTDPTQAGAGPLATGVKLYWKFVTSGTARIDALGGTAQLTGELVNTKVPGLKLVLDLKLTDGQTWEEWKASNPGIADEELFAAQGYRSPRDPDTGEYGPGTTEIIKECADYLNWIYFAVDNSSTATFVNESAGTDYDYLNGITLQIKNLDDITKRVQYGIGANDKDCDLGIGGWFLVEGSIPDPINGGSVAMKVQGDANVDLEIEKTFDCPEPTAVVEEPARFGSVDQTLPTEAQAFKIYPNPASNVLFIEGTNTAEGSYFIEVVDMTGSVMIQRKTQGFDNFKLNVSNFARGFYVVRIVDNNGSNSTFKFLKK